jgi:Glycosyltransferase
MNIAFCYITPFHPNKGGIGRVTDTLCRELQRRGHNVHYLIFESGMTIKHEYDYPAPLTYLPSKELLSEENLAFYHKYLRDNNIDIIIDQGGNFAEFPLWLNTGNDKIKKISVIHTYDTVTYRNLWSLSVIPLRGNRIIDHAKRLARIVLYPRTRKNMQKRMIQSYREMALSTDAVAVLSDHYFDEITELCPEAANKLIAIQNPNPYSDEQLFNISCKKTKTVLFVGLFSTAKSEDRAARIWKKISKKYPDWTFNMIGYGNTQRTNNLKRIVKGIPNFNILGFKEPFPYQQEASILCMTSALEGWPLTLVEAMQCGCVPILYNSFSSATELVRDGKDGYLIPPFDEKEYITKLESLIKNNERRELMSQNARDSIRRFDVTTITDKWEDLFNHLMNNTPNEQAKV